MPKIFPSTAVFGLLVALTLVIYYPARQSGFVTDWLGWQQAYDAGSWEDVLRCFGYPGLQQVTQFVMYGLYRACGTGIGWYLFFCFLHAFNAWLLFELFRKLGRHLGIASTAGMALSGVLLFLLSPYQAEVLIWRACVHYLLSGGFMLLVLHSVVRFLDTGGRRWLLIGSILFFLSLFVLEIALVTPVIALLLAYVWSLRGKPERNLRPLVAVALALGPFWILYFFLNKIVLGTWIGHYGAATHLNFHWVETCSRFFKYLIKHTFFVRYFRHAYKEAIFGYMEQPAFVFASIALGLGLVVAFVRYLRRLPVRWVACGMALAMFFTALAPVATLYMLTLLHGENDRYGYVASMFLMMALAMAFGALRDRYRWWLWGTWIAVSVFYLHRTVQWWADSHQQKQEILSSFRAYDAHEVIVLNLPDNLEGIHLFRIIGDSSALKEDLALTAGKPYSGQIREVAYYNEISPSDGVMVEPDTAVGALKVSFRQWGNWWWRNGIGASDYENESWRVDFQGHFYHLYLKKVPENTVFLYCDGSQLQQVPKEFLERLKTVPYRAK